ncbi:MAG: hypothetical protein RSC00_00075 [Ruthenibacterium sp.]
MDKSIVTADGGQRKHWIVFGGASLAAYLWMFLSQFTEIWFQKRITNIATYVVFVLVFVVSVIILYHVVPAKAYGTGLDRKISSRQSVMLTLGTAMAGVVILVWAFANAKFCNAGAAAMQWAINWRFAVAFLTIGAISLWRFSAICKQQDAQSPQSKWVALSLGGLALLLICFVAWWAYTPNCLNYTWDYEAYWFSAFAAARGIPLTKIISSVYGHYGILMAPFFALVGGFTPARVALLLSVESVAMIVCFCYVLWYAVKRPLLRALGLFAAFDYFATVSTIEGQMTPHRVLFSVFLMAFAVFFLKNKAKHKKWFFYAGIILGYALAMIGLVWSNDSGLAGIVAWSSFHAYFLLSEHAFSWKDLGRILLVVICAALCVFMAWQTVNVVNVAAYHGKPITFSLFMTPLLPDFNYAKYATSSTIEISPSDAAESFAADSAAVKPSTAAGSTNGYLDMLQLPLARKWTPWFAILLLLFFLIVKGMGHLSICKGQKESSDRTAFAFMTAVLSVLLLLYFFNRTDYYNISIAFFCILILIAMSTQKLIQCAAQDERQTVLHAAIRGAAVVAILTLVGFGSAAVGRMPTQLRKVQNCHETTVMSTFFAEMRAKLPEHARIVGTCSTYYNAGLNTPNEDILWFQWVNYLEHFTGEEFAADTEKSIAVTDSATVDYLNEMCNFATIGSKLYDVPQLIQLNYVNYTDPTPYELSKDFYVYRPKAG